MPKPQEFAELIVGGMSFHDWTSVSVTRSFDTNPSTFEFSATEIDGKAPANWTALRVKPGNSCTILMAGQLAITGHVVTRVVEYDKNQHGIQLQGKGRVGDIGDSSLVTKGGQFRGYTWEAIARRVLKDYNIGLSTRQMSDYAQKPFPDIQVQPGETVFGFLHRLARMRGIFLSDDEIRNLVATTAPGQSSTATLEEGKNILAAQCVITDEVLYSTYTYRSQFNGAGDWSKDASQNSATAKDDTVQRYRPFLGVAPEPGSKEDLQRLVDFEMAWAKGESIYCTIVLRGWLQPSGRLWLNAVGDPVHVRSPMLILDMPLAIQTATLSQNNEGGTLTTLILIRPEALGGKANYSGANAATDFGSAPGAQTEPAKPDPPDGLSYYGGTDLIQPGG